MAFTGYLTADQIRNLVEAALGSDLLAIPRSVLMAGLPAGFTASMPLFASPLDQVRADLGKLNGTERLADGRVPLEAYLANAAGELKLRSAPQAAQFADTASRVRNAASGAPALPDAAALPEIVENEQVVADDDSLDIAFLARGAAFAQAVARIAVARFVNGVAEHLPTGAPAVHLGTAWIIGPGLVMTNHHVINARRSDEAPATPADLRQQALGAAVEFGVDSEDATPVVASVTDLVASSPELDYALLAVSGQPAVPVPRINPQLVTLTPTSRLAVNIVQHPGGRAKQVALRNNLVSGTTADMIRYFTDTDYGSSGSPVCDDRWAVVALHRGSRHTDKTNYQGRTEAYVNFGSQIQAVLADLAKSAPAAAAAIAAGQA